jgi:hypothetical protein
MARQVRSTGGAPIVRRSLGVLLAALLFVSCSAAGDEATSSTTAPEAEPVAVTSSTSSTTTTATTTMPTTTTVRTTTTTTPTEPTTTTLAAIGSLESGLFCRDLVPLGYGYADAVAYWTREGRPDRMDADRNGIPCETVYDAKDVVAFWGAPLPTTTTTAVDVWYAVTTPQYDVASLPGAGSNYGSGCSPGSNTLPDGIWFGDIAAADSNRVEFDLMCFAPGEGPGTVTNSNPKLRTVSVASGAVAYHADSSQGIGWYPVPYMTWLTLTPDPGFCPASGCPVWLYVNDGKVTEIVELLFP